MSPELSYFADYEVWTEGMRVSWGNVIVTLPRFGMTAAQVLDAVRNKAAYERLAVPQEIRVRNLVRL